VAFPRVDLDRPAPLGLFRHEGREQAVSRYEHCQVRVARTDRPRRRSHASCTVVLTWSLRAGSYLFVSDADAVYAVWRAAGVEARFRAPVDTSYCKREFGYCDPDGNLLRVGSPVNA
jgi:hypothetical protein